MSEGVARRRWRRLALAAVVLAGAVLALRLGLALLPAERWVSGALSRWAGRPVEIEAVGAFLDRGLRLELRGLRVPEPGGEPLLEIASATGRQSWPRLLAGQLVPLRWELEAPVLRLRPRGDDEAPADPPDLPELDLVVRDGRLEWARTSGPPLVVRELRVEGQRGGLARRASGRVSGALHVGEKHVCDVDASFEGWLDGGVIRGDVSGLDLAQVSTAPLAARGSLEGAFALERDGDALALDVDARVLGLDVQPPGFEAPLQPAIARIDARLERRPDRSVHLLLRRLMLDDADLGGTIELDDARTHTSGRIAIAPFEPGPSPRLHPLSILGRMVPSWGERNARIAAGRVLDAEIRWDAPVEQIGDSFGFRRRPAPGELGVALRVEGGRWRLGSGETLDGISGALRIEGNTLHVEELRAIGADGEPLPRIDLRVEGMHRLAHLPAAEKRAPEGPDAPMPGLATLLSLLAGDGSGGPARELRFEDLELRHSMALLPVRGARGRLVARGPRIRIDAARAIVGGVPARVELRLDRALPALAIDLTYSGADASPPPAPADHWLRGDLALDGVALAGWRVGAPRLRLRAVGDRLHLDRIEGRLATGALRGSGELELGSAAAVPYRLELALEAASATELAPNLGLEPENLSGQLHARGRLAGALAPGASFLDSAHVDLDVRLENGHLGGLPAILAIARLPSLRGASALLGRPLRFDSADGHVAIRDGRVELAGGRLIGPELRLLADGQLELRDPRRQRDVLITLLFLRTVDRVIGSVPLLRDVILGEDENLLAASFRVTGPVDDSSVTYVPPEGLTGAASWATGVLASGARRLGQMIRAPLPARDAPAEEKDAEPEQPAEGAGPGPGSP